MWLKSAPLAFLIIHADTSSELDSSNIIQVIRRVYPIFDKWQASKKKT